MDNWLKEAETQYAALAGYAEWRQNQLTGWLHSYIVATDLYGRLLCGVTLILGQQRIRVCAPVTGAQARLKERV
jgi:hypothetical protein